MKRIISILLLTYPILVFADTLQFKDGRELEGSIILEFLLKKLPLQLLLTDLL